MINDDCGPHCGIKDHKEAHCLNCHHPRSHGNAIWDDRMLTTRWHARSMKTVVTETVSPNHHPYVAKKKSEP